ncbi:helix-turn-helix domain-containing protein [Pseudoclavibacter sp. RFBA6]|uniref:helix-turn-helix domain-containing protein n=1 Tax=Pseudoclavibacter sp. RFBA6 TaxID=2080573 RepID=UPI000CE7A1F3|nr:helix-turn-helix domain-containing protein [Pseudoclavibacter sp. RFBA6]PPG39284.1 hypothetical protein C5C17_10780 [Pseudoclavibacter sp. RFBA6]
MERVARAHYNEATGWSPFPGYRTQQFRIRGPLPPGVDKVLRAGVDLRAPSGTATIEASLLRFDRYLIVRGESSPIDLVWKRERASAQGRTLALFLERGSLEVASNQRKLRLEAAQIAIVPPGAGPVVLHAGEKIAGVIFSFAASELAPLQARWSHSDGGVVREGVLALLDAVTKAPAVADLQSATSLRSLLRAAAHSLLVESTHVANLRDTDTLALVRLIVENRFQVPGFSVDGIAREAGLSRRVLERRLQVGGSSAAAILRERRVQNAEALMREQPGLPAREVASQSGFSSPVTLRRALASQRTGLES